jgi:AraC-like DNA-binding protein
MSYHAGMHFVYWEHKAEFDEETVVVPDGCRDILLKAPPLAAASVVATDWDNCARTVQLTAGQQLCGFRLCPGLSPDALDVSELRANKSDIAGYINQLAGLSQERIELIDQLSNPHVSIEGVAKAAGVCVRTLQRELKRHKLPRSDYWRLLARARRAVSVMQKENVSLTELALICGYSDQAHMTRDFRRWFGVTPVAMRQNLMLLSEVLQPGLGNWTTEQISIR